MSEGHCLFQNLRNKVHKAPRCTVPEHLALLPIMALHKKISPEKGKKMPAKGNSEHSALMA